MVSPEIVEKEMKYRKEVYYILMQINLPYLTNLSEKNIDTLKKKIENYDIENEYDYKELFSTLKEHYLAACIFYTPENEKALTYAFSLSQKQLSLIHNCRDIFHEIEAINSKGYYYIPRTLILIYYFTLYLPTKIYNFLGKQFKFDYLYDGKVRSIAEIEYFKIKQNFNNRSKKGKIYAKNELEELIIALKEIIEVSNFDEIKKIDVEKEFKNDVDYYLKDLYKTIQPFEKQIHQDKSIKKEIELFNLYRLMLNERNWLTNIEFESGEALNKYGIEVGLYSNSYRRYQTLTMRKFLNIS